MTTQETKQQEGFKIILKPLARDSYVLFKGEVVPYVTGVEAYIKVGKPSRAIIDVMLPQGEFDVDVGNVKFRTHWPEGDVSATIKPTIEEYDAGPLPYWWSE
jgi:hypothetical protein